MFCYRFDKRGRFLDKVVCQVDPIASKREGKIIYLYPLLSTTKEPLPPKEGFLVEFHSGEWQYVEDNRMKEIISPIGITLLGEDNTLSFGEFFISEKDTDLVFAGKKVYSPSSPKGVTWISLDKLKILQRNEISIARNIAEQSGFTYLNKVFDSDQLSCMRISLIAQTLGEDETVVWTCKDNSIIELSKAQMLDLAKGLARWSSLCHERSTKLKKMIDAAQTPEAIIAINWDTSPIEVVSESVNSILGA